MRCKRGYFAFVAWAYLFEISLFKRLYKAASSIFLLWVVARRLSRLRFLQDCLPQNPQTLFAKHQQPKPTCGRFCHFGSKIRLAASGSANTNWFCFLLCFKGSNEWRAFWMAVLKRSSGPIWSSDFEAATSDHFWKKRQYGWWCVGKGGCGLF